MELLQLKEKLLKTNLVIDNEFLFKYWCIYIIIYIYIFLIELNLFSFATKLDQNSSKRKCCFLSLPNLNVINDF